MKTARFSRVGFVLAAAGSAVGLGNVWKFPYMTGENGGGAFVLVYLATIILIGVVLFLGEVIMGRLSRKDSVSAFRNLAPKNGHIWKYSGLMVFTGIMILSFYTVVLGWIFKYIVISFNNLPVSATESGMLFGSIIGTNVPNQIIYFSLAFLLTFFIVSKGVKRGIERINLILMPLLILILLVLLIYAINLDGFTQAVSFMFNPDFSKIKGMTILKALGQAFFTLSLGVGCIMTYASSLSDNTNLYRSSLMVAAMDTFIAILAGLIIFTFTFHFGVEPSGGPGLVFVSLPPLFNEMGTFGTIVSLLFFIALAFAGLTSAISLVEPSISFIINNTKLTRFQGLVIIGIVTYILGFMALLSNVKDLKEYVTFFNTGFFDILDFLSSSILMPIGGILVAVFVGFFIQKDKLRALLVPDMGEFIFKTWHFGIRYIVPFGVFLVMINQLFFS